ncbi:STX4 isoform 7 [Pongo abelii]|uniref:STX4 isoform 6 n=1 Tax=Pongo abelii TaxID=9601 RepID=A0A2J8TKP8_PONAB|nr:STX4 isoform 6 [Pongo abelii]PNJ33611.1 STX4 isoform 7 [Pongo abelii]
MRDRTHELRQGDDSSDEEDKERVALVLHPGTARLGSPDEEFFQKPSRSPSPGPDNSADYCQAGE